MEFIKDNLKLIIIIGVSVILLVIILLLISKKGKKKTNAIIQSKPMNSEYKLQAKTVSIFEAINRETEKQSGKTGISYVNDLQKTKTNSKNQINEQKVEEANINPIQTSTDQIEPPKQEIPPKKEETKPIIESKDVLEPPKPVTPVETNPPAAPQNQTSQLEPPKPVTSQPSTIDPQLMQAPKAEEGSLEIHPKNTFIKQENDDIQKPTVSNEPSLDVPIGTALSDLNDTQK